MSDLPNMASPREVMLLFKRYGLKPHHSLGQNFLIDGNTIQKIIAAARLKQGDSVIEIGPGSGALTFSMAASGIRLAALELDKGFAAMLGELLHSFKAATIIQGDALAVDWPDLIARFFPDGNPVKLISNLPYYISAPLMYNLFKAQFPFAEAVLMFQKEVAQRLTASPGDANYGSLTVLCRYYTNAAILFNVSRNVFWPSPGVDSAVIRLEPKQRQLDAAEETLFWKIVRGVFLQRRKTILKNMLSVFPYKREEVADLLSQASIEPGRRPETLDVHEFAKLTRIIYNCGSKSE